MLEEVEVEQVVLNKSGKRAIRLDAWAMDNKNRQFNIFLNMTSKEGKPELVSLLQYMKKTSLDNPEILVKDKRIEKLNEIVSEVKQSEEWEAVRMNILEIGIEQGAAQKLIEQICKKLRKGKSIDCKTAK